MTGQAKGAVLLTGGAGYIGSHTAWALADAGRSVVVLDDLSSGSADLLPREADLVVGAVGDRSLVESVLASRRIETVIHLAGFSVAPRSLQEPLAYYANNLAQSVTLLQACAGKVSRFVFSSTAAVYAPSDGTLLSETDSTDPGTPYGFSKLVFERILRDVGQASDLRTVAFRYFNVAGCDPLGRTGHPGVTSEHLINTACEVARGARPRLELFGVDYPTPDGTCIRDFVHVCDVAQAHVRAVDYLEAGGSSITLNCGYGHGASVREVIAAVEAATSRSLPVEIRPRRAGDLASVIAADRAIVEVLGWTPQHDSLASIVETTLRWKAKAAPRP